MISRNRVRSVLIGMALLMLASLASADSLQLRDGRHFDGQYVGGTESMVAFFTQGSIEYFPVHEVLLVVFGDGGNQSIGPLGLQFAPSPMSGHETVRHRNHLRTTGDNREKTGSKSERVTEGKNTAVRTTT
jgi:hypothetical protein